MVPETTVLLVRLCGYIVIITITIVIVIVIVIITIIYKVYKCNCEWFSLSTFDFGRQRGFYLMERTHLRRWASCRKKSCFLEFMYVDVARDFVGVVFHILLDGAKGSYNHRDCCCFEPSLQNALNLDFQVFLFVTFSFSVVLIEVLVSRGIVMSMRRQVLSFLFFSTMFCLLAAMVLSVDGHLPQNDDAILLGDSLGFMLISSSFTSMPNSLQIVQCMCAAALLWRWYIQFVLASSGKPETRWSMVSSKRPHSLHFRSSSGLLSMLCCYQRVGRLWSWAAMIKSSVSALRPAAFSHLWVLSCSSLFHPLWVFAVERFWFQLEPEQLVTLVFDLGLCSEGIGGVRLILGRWYCRHSQFPIELHWLSANGIQGFPVVRVFDKVEEGEGIYQDR